MTPIQFSLTRLCGVLLVCGLAPQVAIAQRGAPDGAAALTVEGRVTRLYESSDGGRLVELWLQSVALGEDVTPLHGVRVPAPGETVYVVLDTRGGARRPAGARTGTPEVGASVRARLTASDRGTWTAAPDALETLAPAASRRSGGGAFEPSATTVQAFGMSCEATLVGGRFGLEVKRVEPASAASSAGFQPGDVVVAIDGRPVSTAAELHAAGEGAAEVKLTVVDVNTSRVVDVAIRPLIAGPSTPNASRGEPRPAGDNPDTRIAASLGIAVAPIRHGLRTVVQVVSVNPGSPGADAGLEPGDVIVRVGGRQVSSVAEFSDAIPPRPGRLALVVQDVRTGQEASIEVASAGPAAPRPPRPMQADAPTSAAAGRLGIAGELAFYDAEAAVKVVRVTTGSPAERAGIRAGMILRAADGAPLLHPDDLTKAELAARSRLQLEVVDPSTGRESSVNVEL